MSTDWNIYCVDCGETLKFNDANHIDKEMRVLCKHAAAIAALAPMFQEMKEVAWNGMCLSLPYGSYGSVEPDWFARHLGHRLRPINEYGYCDDECGEMVRRDRPEPSDGWDWEPCCLLDGHEGPHDAEVARRKERT